MRLPPSPGPARLLQRHRYGLLFWTLLATITIGPLLEAMRFGRGAVEALLCASLVAAVFPVGMPLRRHLLLVLVLGIQTLRWLADDEPGDALSIAGSLLWCALGMLAAVHAVRHAMSTAQVGAEHLYAALSGYLLIGVCGGVIVAALSAASPGAMLFAGQPLSQGLDLGDSIYFSFVTLATLGYGDITPASKVMRGLAVLLAIIGQLYLALLVARLVGLRSVAPAE